MRPALKQPVPGDGGHHLCEHADGHAHACGHEQACPTVAGIIALAAQMFMAKGQAEAVVVVALVAVVVFSAGSGGSGGGSSSGSSFSWR